MNEGACEENPIDWFSNHSLVMINRHWRQRRRRRRQRKLRLRRRLEAARAAAGAEEKRILSGSRQTRSGETSWLAGWLGKP